MTFRLWRCFDLNLDRLLSSFWVKGRQASILKTLSRYSISWHHWIRLQQEILSYLNSYVNFRIDLSRVWRFGFEFFSFFFMVLDTVLTNLVSNTFVIKKVTDSVSKKYWIRYQKSIGLGIETIWYQKKVSNSVSIRF